jgi:hypothetical protein
VTTLEIIILAVIVVLAVFAIGGHLARRAQLARTQGAFEQHLSQINQELAAARAEDRGWEPELVDAAARAAYTERVPGGDAEALTLVQVIDRPGTGEDKAVYADATGRRLTLGRRDGAWVFESIA